jgi:hypothetical protein
MFDPEYMSTTLGDDREGDQVARQESTRPKELDVVSWLFGVVAWDGLLPIGVYFTGRLLRFLSQRNNDVAGPLILLASVIVLPVAAFLMRYLVGRRHIHRNNCSESTRRVQFAVFVFGVSNLALGEAWLTLFGIVPNLGPFFGQNDPYVLGAFYCIYLVAMVISMFPGARASDDEFFDFGNGTARPGGPSRGAD